MTAFTWHPTPVPSDLPVRQVYGFLFQVDGRILLRGDRGRYSLPGGRPEPGESTYAATLRREVDEEVHAELAEPTYLGYQRVDEQDGTPPYAQVRMTARLTALHDPRPDPDTGRAYDRHLVPPDQVGDLLAWGELGHRQVRDAAAAACALLGVPTPAPDAETT